MVSLTVLTALGNDFIVIMWFVYRFSYWIFFGCSRRPIPISSMGSTIRIQRTRITTGKNSTETFGTSTALSRPTAASEGWRTRSTSTKGPSYTSTSNVLVSLNTMANITIVNHNVLIAIHFRGYTPFTQIHHTIHSHDDIIIFEIVLL